MLTDRYDKAFAVCWTKACRGWHTFVHSVWVCTPAHVRDLTRTHADIGIQFWSIRLSLTHDHVAVRGASRNGFGTCTLPTKLKLPSASSRRPTCQVLPLSKVIDILVGMFGEIGIGVAWQAHSFFNQTNGAIWPLTPTISLPKKVQQLARHAYMASVSWMDHQIGRIMDELEALRLTSTTVCVLHGDHGAL